MSEKNKIHFARFTPQHQIEAPESVGHFSVYFDITCGDATYVRVLSGSGSASVRQFATLAFLSVLVMLNADNPFQREEEIPPGEVDVEHVKVRHILRVDGDGYPVIIEPSEYEDLVDHSYLKEQMQSMRERSKVR